MTTILADTGPNPGVKRPVKSTPAKALAAAKHREAHRETLRLRAAAYRVANPDKVSEQTARYNKNNHAEIARKRACHRAQDCARAKSQQYSRKRNLRKLGLTFEEYDEMLAGQGGKCLICDATEGNSIGHRLAVDHCHKTGLIRGLLCKKCNSALGLLGDSHATVARAAAYLRTFS